MSRIFILLLLLFYFGLFCLHYFYVYEPYDELHNNSIQNSKKRIAIVLSGRINTDQKQYENFKKQFEKCNADIFVSHSKGYSKEVIDKFIEWYKPKMIQESDETYIEPNCPDILPRASKHNILCMFKNRYNALELLKQYEKRHSFQYDIIISSRCDLFLKSDPIDFETFSNEGLYLPIIFDHGGINDQFAFGNNKDMKTYLNMFSHIQNLCKKVPSYYAETLLQQYLIDNEINIKRVDLSYELNRTLKNHND